jgi:hypothetical protein
MKICVIDMNTELTVVYYNEGKPLHLFMIHTNVTLHGLKDHLNQINHQRNHRETRRADDVEYRRPSTNPIGSVQFCRMKLMNDDDVGTMFSIFVQYSSKGRSSCTFFWYGLLNKFRKV